MKQIIFLVLLATSFCASFAQGVMEQREVVEVNRRAKGYKAYPENFEKEVLLVIMVAPHANPYNNFLIKMANNRIEKQNKKVKKWFEKNYPFEYKYILNTEVAKYKEEGYNFALECVAGHLTEVVTKVNTGDLPKYESTSIITVFCRNLKTNEIYFGDKYASDEDIALAYWEFARNTRKYFGIEK